MVQETTPEEIDESEDELLSEEDALARAKAEGIEFVDHFAIENDPDHRKFDTEAEAKKAAKKGEIVMQVRERAN